MVVKLPSLNCWMAVKSLDYIEAAIYCTGIEINQGYIDTKWGIYARNICELSSNFN